MVSSTACVPMKYAPLVPLPAVSVQVGQLTLRVTAELSAFSRRVSTSRPRSQFSSARVLPSLSVM